MFINSSYIKCDDHNISILGFDHIQIRERVLSRTETRDRKNEEGETVAVTSYYYALNCLVEGLDIAEIDEDEFQAEIISGIYVLESYVKAAKSTMVTTVWDNVRMASS